MVAHETMITDEPEHPLAVEIEAGETSAEAEAPLTSASLTKFFLPHPMNDVISKLKSATHYTMIQDTANTIRSENVGALAEELSSPKAVMKLDATIDAAVSTSKKALIPVIKKEYQMSEHSNELIEHMMMSADLAAELTALLRATECQLRLFEEMEESIKKDMEILCDIMKIEYETENM